MYNFYNILQKSNERTEKRLLDDIICFDRNSQPFFRMLKEYYEENPNATDEEVYDYFSQMFADINLEIVKIPIIKNATLEYNICKYLNRNDHERKEAYEKVRREEERKGKTLYSEDGIRDYNSNRLSASRMITIQALKEMRERQDGFSPEDRKEIEAFFRLPRSVQSKHKRTLDSATRRNFDELKDLFAENEYTQFSIFLKKCEPLLAEHLKEDYITSITTLGNMFKTLGLLSDYSRSHDELMGRLRLEGLEYPLEKSEENTLSIEDLFKEENLKKLPLEQLSMLNSFWLNRFTKEVEYINKAFFIVKNMGLLDEIKSAKPEGRLGYISPKVDKDELRGLYSKMNFLHQLSTMILYKFKDEEGETLIEEIPNSDKKRVVKRIDAEPVFMQLHNDIGNQYASHFGKVTPEAGNSLVEELEDYRIMENAIHNTYRAKDKNIIAILSNLYETGFSKNWGIIQEKGYKDSRMILLGIDVAGLNMPVRLHVERSLVKDFLKGYKGDTMFPIYDGDKDFNVLGEYMRTPLLMPICDKQKRGLKELMQKPIHPYKNLVEHLSFLSTGDFPDHLKIDTISKKKGKKKIIRKAPPKRYIDLSTGDEFTENVKGEYVKIELPVVKKEGRTYE